MVLAVVLLLMPVALADSCAVYFTGIGCPHCARTDPYVLEELTEKYTDFIIIEYEIYQEQSNPPMVLQYHASYGSGYGIPLVIYDDRYISGDVPILNNFIPSESKCPLADGTAVSFSELDLTTLPGKPKIWRSDRILVGSGEADNELLHTLLMTDNIAKTLNQISYTDINPKKIQLSGKEVEFDHAVKIEDWIFQWNGNGTGGTPSNGGNNGENPVDKDLTVAKIISLAVVDAVNPCAIAVLTLMLIAIITANPQKRRKVLYAGFAFVAAVFLMYMFYGLVIIRFFQLVQALTSVRLVLYQILGLAAIILGILNIKDFFSYKPGSLGTEMPVSLRPRMKRIVSGITSAKGAVVIGAFVTLFLLPCTIGPYIIAGGILSSIQLLQAVPWLLLYNFIFVLPMIAIVLLVYAGIAKVDDVSEWKEKNIKKLHLISGIIILLLGIAMVLGLV